MESTFQMIVILIVFSVNGSMAAYLMRPVMDLLGITKDIGLWLYWPLAMVLILPVYFPMLLVTGWIFGQFRFFWEFEKRTFSRMGLGFLFGEKRKKEG